MSSVTPARVLQIAGGVGIVIASFLQWSSELLVFQNTDGEAETFNRTSNGWDVGMLGLWQTLLGAALVIAAIAAITSPGSVPKQIFGFAFDRALMAMAFPVLLWNFALQFDDVFGGVGLLLGWIAAALAIVGSELQESAFG